MRHLTETNFPELIGLYSDAEGEVLVKVEYEKNPPSFVGRDFDTSTTITLLPMNVNAVMSCIDDIQDYVSATLSAINAKDLTKLNSPNPAAATAALSGAQEKRDIITVYIEKPTLRLIATPDSYQWHELTPGNLSVAKEGGVVTVTMRPDDGTGQCHVSMSTVGDFKGSVVSSLTQIN